MDIILTIIGIIIIILLMHIMGDLIAIRKIVTMSDQERHEYNLSIDEPDLYDDILISKESEKINNKK